MNTFCPICNKPIMLLDKKLYCQTNDHYLIANFTDNIESYVLDIIYDDFFFAIDGLFRGNVTKFWMSKRCSTNLITIPSGLPFFTHNQYILPNMNNLEPFMKKFIKLKAFL